MKMDIDIEAMIKERETWVTKELTFEVRKQRHESAWTEIAFTYGTSEIRNWIVLAGAMADGSAEMNLLAYEPMYRSPAGTGCGCAFAYWR